MKTPSDAWANKVLKLLEKSWSHDTSSLWCVPVPSRGQCGVTALVINDSFGGEILKIPVNAGWHFYNRIDGVRLDFARGQFPEEIAYEDIPSTREEAFGDTNEWQYWALAEAFQAAREATCLGSDPIGTN